jgi:spore germination cell wall hydrolase CwlJ-like protein
MQKRLYILLSLLSITLLTSILIVGNVQESKTKIIEIKHSQLTKEAQKQVDCLAENIYFESAYEPFDGRVAVALVTLNRVNDPRYPNNICDVVKQKTRIVSIGDKRIVCQFSWYCEQGKHIGNIKAYNEANKIALHVYVNYEQLKDLTHGALFYHADYVNPRWRGLEKTVVIGRHIFYKERNDL